jgi:DNA-binding HxlR family transcriptional regulator
MGTNESLAVEFDIFDPRCPTRQVLDLIGDRWTVMIVLSLYDETMRFSELRSRLSDISPKVLTNVLRKLERDGLVSRKVYAEVPPRVEYSLTGLGRSLEAPLRAVRDWAVDNMAQIEKARAVTEDATPAT